MNNDIVWHRVTKEDFNRFLESAGHRVNLISGRAGIVHYADKKGKVIFKADGYEHYVRQDCLKSIVKT